MAIRLLARQQSSGLTFITSQDLNGIKFRGITDAKMIEDRKLVLEVVPAHRTGLVPEDLVGVALLL